MSGNGNKPIAKYKSAVSYGVQLTAWKGKHGPSFTIQKRGKDKNTGEYREYSSMFPTDLAALRVCIDQALADQSIYQKDTGNDAAPDGTGFEGYPDAASPASPATQASAQVPLAQDTPEWGGSNF